MTAASKSVYYFGFYLLLTGITLVIAPNFLLSAFRMPETTEVWIRIVGVLVFNIGILYIQLAPGNNPLFLLLTVYLRLTILVWFTVFVVSGLAPAMLIPFGIVDAVGAAWTYFALRKYS